MAIDVPYPQMVAQNGLGFTRGQCALDQNGRVLRPYDLLGQAEIIAAGLVPILEAIGANVNQPVRVVAYYLDNGSINEEQLRENLGRTLGGFDASSIVLIPLSHFYYDGMMVEIDFLFAEDVAEPVAGENLRPPFADAVLSGDLIFISQIAAEPAPDGGDQLIGQLTAIRDRLEAVLGSAGGELDDIIKLNTYFTGNAFDWARMAEARSEWFEEFYPVITDAGVSCLGTGNTTIAMDAIAVRRAAPNHWRREPIHLRGHGHWPIDLPHPQAIRMDDLVITGGQLAVSHNNTVTAPYVIDEQTHAVMDHLGRVLDAAGASFSDVIKATTYYRGGANADDLHDNLAIRSGYYSKPGPASTGVPVAGLPAAAAMISVEVMAIR